MNHRIRITSIRRYPLDTSKLAQALIELVRYQQEQEELKSRQRSAPQRKRKEQADGPS